jgi:hypothetical protein
MSERNLSDGDVIAIVDALEERLTDKFYRDIGKGFWGFVWKGLLGAAMFLAAYGAGKYGGTS